MKNSSKKHAVTMGEIMLRLKSPAHERLLQTPKLEATFGGSESNVAISLSNYKIPACFITALPPNLIGDACMQFLKAWSVDTSFIRRSGERLGTYYVEAGSGPRPSVVIYDRKYSSISTASVTDFEWDAIFSKACWFHISGITPALSQAAADLSLRAVKEAKKHEVPVSCDLNYRGKLWKYGKSAPEVMTKLMPYIDVIVANEEDIQLSLGIELDQAIVGEELSRQKYRQLCERVLEVYPHLSHIAISLRESITADYNEWGAMSYVTEKETAYFSKRYSLTDIVDRVGGGDSFAAGFVYSILAELEPQEGLEFAVAASALKHTIPGDINRVSVEDVKKLAAGQGSGRIKR